MQRKPVALPNPFPKRDVRVGGRIGDEVQKNPQHEVVRKTAYKETGSDSRTDGSESKKHNKTYIKKVERW